MGANGIYGLSGSGLDIESLVKMGMLNKQNQLDKMQQQETTNTWLKEEWATIYDKFTTYKYSTLTDYKMQSNMSAMQATSSNSGVVTATANGAAAAMTHQVAVNQMASNAYMMTGDGWGITRETGMATSTNLSDIIGMGAKATGDEDSNGKPNYEVGGKKVNGSDVAISITIADSVNADGTYNTKTLEYTYADIFDSKKTLYDFATDIAKTGSNIQGSYDSTNDSFSLYNKTGGSGNIIGLTAANSASEKLLNNLHLSAFDTNSNKLGVYDSAGNFNSTATVDGKSQVYTFKSEDSLPTKLETSNIVRSVTNPTSLKDVLGLSASLSKDSSGQYTLTVKDMGNKDASGNPAILTTITGTDFQNLKDNMSATNAFSLQLDDGTVTDDVSFSYADIFDVQDTPSSTTTVLKSKATLSDLSDKMNAASTNIMTNYDEANDSFGVRNMSGKANITADGADVIGNRMIDSLNLQDSDEITALGITSTADLKSLFGLSATFNDIKVTSSTHDMSMVITDGTNTDTLSGRNIRAKFIGENSEYAKKEFAVLTVSDGTNSADISLTYGDIFDFNKFTAGSSPRITYNGIGLNGTSTEVNVASNTNLGTLAERINKAAQDAGVNVTAGYSASGEFTLVNYDGPATITSKAVNGSNLSAQLSLEKISLDDVTAKVSGGIKRVNTTSTENDLASILGISAVKNVDDTLTIKDSSGNESIVSADDKAFELEVGDTNNKAIISFTYKDLFDTSGSGTLKTKADMSTLQSKINAAGLDVKASYDAENDSFTMSNAGGYVKLSADNELGKKLIKNLGMKESSDTSGAKSGIVKGTDAEVTIDGKKYTLDSNKQTVAGVTYTFTGKTEGTTASVVVSQDTDKIVDYVKKFVDDYNTLLDYMNDKLAEEKYRDYKPLTAKQEEQMTENQITKWTEKAKSGLLYHNSTLQSIVSQMREAIYTPVDAVDSIYNSASAIGISSSTVKGHLTLNEETLKKALAADPDCVYQIFASDQDSSYIAGSTDKNKITNSQKKLDYKNTGLANRLTKVMTNVMSTVSDYAGTSKETDDQSYLGKLITNLKTKMSTFKTQMSAFESMLYKKYDAMESALQGFGVQLNYITGYGN